MTKPSNTFSFKYPGDLEYLCQTTIEPAGSIAVCVVGIGEVFITYWLSKHSNEKKRR
jgi:hypothetical protein